MKEFVRSGIGQDMVSPENLRTLDALVKTTDYLLGSILDVSTHGESWLCTTNFITDRLRAVRKGIIIQQLCNKEVISIFERIVRYHILIMYILNPEEIDRYDPVLNQKLLKTYISDLMDMYSNFLDKGRVDELSNYYEFRSYYILSNMEESSIVSNELKLYNDDKRGMLKHALDLILNHRLNNFHRVFNSIENILSFLQACVLLDSLNSIRVAFLKIMNKAFGLKFSIECLCDWLKFDHVEDLKILLKLLGIRFDSSYVYFAKDKSFHDITPLELRKECIGFMNMKILHSQRGGNMSPTNLVNGWAEERVAKDDGKND